ncbi:MAG: methyltransferase domain-containing protein [Acidobacteria bacterium]|nr:methyltransferase domain-containing protein [Acidobacteriota bacterium]
MNDWGSEIDAATSHVLDAFSGNPWFTETFWPESQERVRYTVLDVVSRFPPDPRIRLLDVGCFNGYMSILFSFLGYQVIATDACDLPDRRILFEGKNIEFFFSNLNEPDPLPRLAGGSFHIVLMGEVIEHVLNHPLGLMVEIARVLMPGGMLILTTPNPATVMNAFRLLTGRWSLWGTREFMEKPKIESRGIIIDADIHYREYLTPEVNYLLGSAGFDVERVRYLGFGASRQQSFLKRGLKQIPLVRSMMAKRPFASTQYFLARRPPVAPLNPLA